MYMYDKFNLVSSFIVVFFDICPYFKFVFFNQKYSYFIFLREEYSTLRQ